MKRMADPAAHSASANPHQESRAMPGHDAELDQFRQGVSCAVLLEQANAALAAGPQGQHTPPP